MRCLFVLLLLASCAVSVTTAQSPAPISDKVAAQRETLKKFQEQLKQAANTVMPSVACIVVSRSDRYPKAANSQDTSGKLGVFDREEFLKINATPERIKLAKSLDLKDEETIPDHGCVGGVIFDSAGLILTTYHAIEGATKIYVFLKTQSGMNVGSYANILAADGRSDLAVLKLINPPKDLKAITFADVLLVQKGNKKPTIAQLELVALAARTWSPEFRLDKPSIEVGAITNIHKLPNKEIKDIIVISDSYYKFGWMLEHNIHLNAGVTGGVLIDLDGNMIGLTTSLAVVNNKELGPGYAIPIDENVRRVIDVLSNGEEVEYGFLGIRLKDDSLEVMEVTPLSPADIAGLEPTDVIRQINGIEANSYGDLLLYAGGSLAGTTIKLRVFRGRENGFKNLELTLGKFNNPQPFIASVRPEPVFGLTVDYLSILAQPTNQPPGRVEFRKTNDLSGVCIRDINSNSPAAAKIKTLGENPYKWYITHVNNTTVRSPAEFYKAAKGQTSLKLTFQEWNENGRRELTIP